MNKVLILILIWIWGFGLTTICSIPFWDFTTKRNSLKFLIRAILWFIYLPIYILGLIWDLIKEFIKLPW